MEGSQQSQLELDDSLMSSLSNIKSICVTENTINAEQSIIMHIQTTSNDNSNMQKQASMESQNKISHVHTSLPAHRIRRPGPFNASLYLTSFDSSAVLANRDVIMWDVHRSWIREGLLAKHENKSHDQDRYKKGKTRIPETFDFGVDIVDNKN